MYKRQVAGQCFGNYVGHDSATDEKQCTDLCDSKLNCKWSSLNPTKGDCTMFSDCSVINATNCDGCLTNERGCVPKQCNVNGKCKVLHNINITLNLVNTHCTNVHTTY